MTINYNGKTFNSIEELIEYKRTHPEEMEGVEVADKIIVNNFSSIDTLKDFGSRHSSNEAKDVLPISILVERALILGTRLSNISASIQNGLV